MDSLVLPVNKYKPCILSIGVRNYKNEFLRVKETYDELLIIQYEKNIMTFYYPRQYTERTVQFSSKGPTFYGGVSINDDSTPFVTNISPVSCILVLYDYTNIKINDRNLHCDNDYVIVPNLVPNTEYHVTFSNGKVNDNTCFTLTFKTSSKDSDTICFAYNCTRAQNDVYNLSIYNSKSMKTLKERSVMKTGDQIYVQNDIAIIANDSDLCKPKSGQKLYLVPSLNKKESCIKVSDQELYYDDTESYVRIKENRFTHGDKFFIGDLPVLMIRGSIILHFIDELPVLFPFNTSVAAQALTGGDLIARDLVVRSIYQVSEKAQTGETRSNTSFYVYDPNSDSTMEATCISHSVSEDMTSATIEMGVLSTNSNIQTIESTLKLTDAKTTIRSMSGNSLVNTSFDSTGISFDADNASIYFGADKSFRIHYEPGSLSIQAFDLESNTYVTRSSIT